MYDDITNTNFIVANIIINSVTVFGEGAFSTYDLWYDDLINRAIPAMGEHYMKLFITAGFNPRKFLIFAMMQEKAKQL